MTYPLWASSFQGNLVNYLVRNLAKKGDRFEPQGAASKNLLLWFRPFLLKKLKPPHSKCLCALKKNSGLI